MNLSNYNVRDLSYLNTIFNKKIKKNMLVRSSSFYSSDNFDCLVDLRNCLEKQETDSSCKSISLPLYDEKFTNYILGKIKTMKKTQHNYDEINIEIYKECLLGSCGIKSLRSFFQLLIEGKTIRYFCKWGKDRTGIVSMLIENVLDVEQNEIEKDYLISKANLKKLFTKEKILWLIEYKNPYALIMFDRHHQTKLLYLRSAIDAVSKKYGSIEKYIKLELKIQSSEINKIKNNYLLGS